MSIPTFPESEGSFSVDYRDYDGHLIIGSGDWSFETRWSSAGDGEIHVYNDAQNVRAVAVAPSARRISDVTESIYDKSNFTSRSRTPAVGQVVLVENVNGHAAAILIKAVRISEEGEPGTILSADYKILTDRSRNFSSAVEPKQLAALAAIDEALRELRLIEDDITDKSPNAAHGTMIGHNQPPSEYVFTAEDLNELGTALDLTKIAVLAPDLDQEKIGKSIQTISSKSSKLKDWVGARLAEVQRGAFQAIGGILTAAVLKLSGHLDYVIDVLRALF